MGGGASTLIRLRKAIVIRSYNLREPDQTLDQQFRRFAVQGSDGKQYITVENIRSCLRMESKEYEWIDYLFQHTFGGRVSDIDYVDFLRFLESGKTPNLVEAAEGKGGTGKSEPSLGFVSQQSSSNSSHKGFLDPITGLPPAPPSNYVLSSSGVNTSSYRTVAEASSVRIERAKDSKEHSPQPEEEEEEVININLSSIAANPQSLPDSVKLQTDAVERYFAHGGADDEDSYSLIIHPSSSSSKLGAGPVDAQPKPLWRKRETVRQERTIHYTTIDASGEQQELVEKETTQSEVLHMECKETGEFAHRETTQYEQMETFNEEVVAESKGAEEYVHLKSLEDEYHYMESTMPNRKEQEQQHGEGGEGEQRGAEGAEGPDGESGMRPQYEFQEERVTGEGEEALSGEAAAQQAALEAEYAEAYELYQRKHLQEQQQHQQQGEHAPGGAGEGNKRFGEHAGIGQRFGNMQAPSPRPPPFSDEEAGQAYGFSRGAGGVGGASAGGAPPSRAMDMQDAFAFAAAMDAGDDDVRGDGNGEENGAAGSGGADQLFGELVEVTEGEGLEGPEGEQPGVSAIQQSGKGASYDKSYLFTPLTVPAEGGNLTRSSSYESLHEID